MREGEWEVCSTIYMPHIYHLHYYTCGTHVQSYCSHHIQCHFFKVEKQCYQASSEVENKCYLHSSEVEQQHYLVPIHTVNLKLLGPVNISTCWLLLTTKTGLHLTAVPVFHTFNQTSTQLVSTTFYHVTQYPSRDLNIPSLRHHYGTLSPNFHV